MRLQSEKIRLAEFFRTEYRKLLGFVRRRVDEIAAQDAEDVVHDVVVQIFNKADIAVPIEHLSAYIYHALQNRIIDHFRQRKKFSGQRSIEIEQTWSGISQDEAPDGYDLIPEIRQMEIAHDLDQLLKALNDEEKRLIIATEIQGQTMSELSHLWNVPLNTLLSRKTRAIKKMQRNIQTKQPEKE
jgi:RNA polymerase sigma-70 factor (ECF subfamily)